MPEEGRQTKAEKKKIAKRIRDIRRKAIKTNERAEYNKKLKLFQKEYTCPHAICEVQTPSESIAVNTGRVFEDPASFIRHLYVNIYDPP